jgi:hypothetical protein
VSGIFGDSDLVIAYRNEEHVESVKRNFTKAGGITQTQHVAKRNMNCKIQRHKRSAVSSLSLHGEMIAIL